MDYGDMPQRKRFDWRVPAFIAGVVVIWFGGCFVVSAASKGDSEKRIAREEAARAERLASESKKTRAVDPSVTPTAPETTPAPVRHSEVFVIAKESMYLFDSKQSLALARQLAERGDYVNSSIHLGAHAVPIDSGTRVTIVSGWSDVLVQAEGGGPGGWTTRESLARVNP